MNKATNRRRTSGIHHFGPVIGLFLTGLACPSIAAAQSRPEDMADLRSQLEALRAEQQRSARRIQDLEAALNRPVLAAPAAPTVIGQSAAMPVQAVSEKPALARVQLSGDVRVRYENNFGDRDARDRGRGVLRARLRGSYAVNKWLSVGGQVATGDPDDPNSTDITLSNFDDDLQLSLDQAYIRASFGNLQINAGKIAQPFVRTDLVWDGDVSPQGLSASYKMPLGSGASLKATGLYFLVDESVSGPDSDMIGGQIGFETASSAPWKLELAAAYYDYSLRSTAGGDSGDFRSNLFVNGRYVSDFNLLDVVGAVSWRGLGEAWPVRIVGDYVKNLGAATREDTGFGADLFIGRASRPRDWRFGYGYAAAETDAVLAAFSHDNTSIATNYRQHSLSVDYMLASNLMLNATLYHYRPKGPLHAGGDDPHDWLDRVRFNLMVSF